MATSAVFEIFNVAYLEDESIKTIDASPGLPIISTYTQEDQWTHALWNAKAVQRQPRISGNADPWLWSNYGNEILTPLFREQSNRMVDWTDWTQQTAAMWYREYREMNFAMLQRVIATYRSGDIIWIHGMHFFLLPGLIRRVIPHAIIGYQFHDRFSYSQHLLELSTAAELFTSVVQSDMIAFEDEVSKERFIQYLETELSPADGRELETMTEFYVLPIAYNDPPLPNELYHTEPLTPPGRLPFQRQIRKHHVYHSSPLVNVTDACAEAFEQHANGAAEIADKRYSRMSELTVHDLEQDKWADARHRLFLFDYDGTLTPIRREPNEAVPGPSVFALLESLINDARNSVYIISGRHRTFLHHHFGRYERLGLCAEHGCFASPPGQQTWDILLTDRDLEWHEEATALLENLVSHVPGSEVERKAASVTWHYRQAQDQQRAEMYADSLYAYLLRYMESRYDIRVFSGKKNIEMRPKCASKGEYVKKIFRDLEADKRGLPDYVFCAGDDVTDEDMFHEVMCADEYLGDAGVINCYVGSLGDFPTLAYYHVSEPDELVRMLSTKCGLR